MSSSQYLKRVGINSYKSANYRMSQPYHTDHDLLVILGPTATGKTKLAVKLADKLQGEIISADSRQVYRDMDIGTGKDLNEYVLNGNQVSYHLIDIVNPKEEYNVFQFQQDFQQVLSEIQKSKKLPILCGGTGFYIKAILMDFHLPTANPNKKLRLKLASWEMDDLIQELESILPGASTHMLCDTKRRIIRAIEVETNRIKKKGIRGQLLEERRRLKFGIQNPLVLGVEYPRDIIRKQITQRLNERIENGMIEEVKSLIKHGVTHKKLDSLGLEYRFISRYLQEQISREEMIEKLNTAIHQFAKKQMTFFRNMEKNGIRIHWIQRGNLTSALDLIRSN